MSPAASHRTGPSCCSCNRASLTGHARQREEFVWAYCHVPNGSTADMTEPILSQVERFAPGFRDTILATHVSTPADLAAYNPNYVGGDITGGRFDLRQLFNRPARPWDPYSTPDPGIFICSASTPPGAGVHGMSGYHARQIGPQTAFRLDADNA